MTTETFTLFFAMLTVAADVLVVAGAGIAVAARLRPGGAAGRALQAVRERAGGSGLWFAWLVAAVATAGSLYLSEAAHFVPCKLCWYQRIAMYPLVVVLAVAAFRRDAAVRRYVLPLTGIGAAISMYHYVIQRFPNLTSASCDPTAPCTFTWVWKFHYISIPFMALSAFALIATTLLLIPRDEPFAAEEMVPDPEHDELHEADDHEVMIR